MVNQREGNNRPRVARDDANWNLYNAQGFPSKGLKYAKGKLQDYRSNRGNGFILASICGIPPNEDGLDVAFEETKILLRELSDLVDGFVWNPFSPNTAALKLLRNPETFREYGRLVKETSGSRLALVKMGPYDDVLEKREEWLDLVSGFMDCGGDGVVVVNTYRVPKEQIPSREWGYDFAGVSGRFLVPYRDRAIRDVRRNFQDVFIVGTGGINSTNSAWSVLDSGANALEGYTPYTQKGFGLIGEMTKGIREKLHIAGRDSLWNQSKVRNRLV